MRNKKPILLIWNVAVDPDEGIKDLLALYVVGRRTKLEVCREITAKIPGSTKFMEEFLTAYDDGRMDLNQAVGLLVEVVESFNVDNQDALRTMLTLGVDYACEKSRDQRLMDQMIDQEDEKEKWY